MGLKLKNGKIVGERRRKDESDSNDEIHNPDELVMVMMPRVAWDEFRMLADEYGGSAAQAISTALKLLKEALRKEDGHDA